MRRPEKHARPMLVTSGAAAGLWLGHVATDEQTGMIVQQIKTQVKAIHGLITPIIPLFSVRQSA